MVFIGCVWPRKSLGRNWLVCKYKWEEIESGNSGFAMLKKSAVSRMQTVRNETTQREEKERKKIFSHQQLSKHFQVNKLIHTKKDQFQDKVFPFRSCSLKVAAIKLNEIN